MKAESKLYAERSAEAQLDPGIEGAAPAYMFSSEEEEKERDGGMHEDSMDSMDEDEDREQEDALDYNNELGDGENSDMYGYDEELEQEGGRLSGKYWSDKKESLGLRGGGGGTGGQPVGRRKVWKSLLKKNYGTTPVFISSCDWTFYRFC